MDFYRNMLIYFFYCNHLTIDLLDFFIECNEEKAFDFMRERFLAECSLLEIMKYCKENGVEKQDRRVIFEELQNGI